MSRGGYNPKAGRPKGSTNRPAIRNYFTDEEIRALVEDAKEKAKTDPNLQRFLLEQIFGKAVQPIGNDDDKPFMVAGVEIRVRK